MSNPSIGAYQMTPHGYQIKVLAPGVDANVFAMCRCAHIYGSSCWCPHNRGVPPCEECEQGAPPHHFSWCPLYEVKPELSPLARWMLSKPALFDVLADMVDSLRQWRPPASNQDRNSDEA